MYQCACTERRELVNLSTGLRQNQQNSSSSPANSVLLMDASLSAVPSPVKTGGAREEATEAALRRHSTHYGLEGTLGDLMANRRQQQQQQQPGKNSSKLNPTLNNLALLKEKMHHQNQHHHNQVQNNNNKNSSSSNENNKNNSNEEQQKKKKTGPEIVRGEDGVFYLVRRKSMYHWFWWDSLVDSRSASILQREVADANETGYIEEEVEENQNQDNTTTNDDETSTLHANNREQTRSPKIETMNVG